jgi:hypothetical protein
MKKRVNNDSHIWVQVNPDVNNPIQCYYCFEYGRHFAEEFQSTRPACEKCGNREHYVEKCELPTEDFICIHCQGEHGARVRICPAFVELKTAKLNECFTKITGVVAIRPTPKLGQKIDYEQLVKNTMKQLK